MNIQLLSVFVCVHVCVHTRVRVRVRNIISTCFYSHLSIYLESRWQSYKLFGVGELSRAIRRERAQLPPTGISNKSDKILTFAIKKNIELRWLRANS